jgi:hypothetical protein
MIIAFIIFTLYLSVDLIVRFSDAILSYANRAANNLNGKSPLLFRQGRVKVIQKEA